MKMLLLLYTVVMLVVKLHGGDVIEEVNVIGCSDVDECVV